MRTARKEGIQKLYHYQGSNLAHLRCILLENRVRFSNPVNFNDPWDCRPYFDTASLDDPACRRKWGTFLEPEVARLPAESQAAIRGLGANWFDTPSVLGVVVGRMTRGIGRRIEEIWRIYCLTPHPDSLLMWAHYADKHKGICLEFDATREFGGAFRVVYRDEMTAIDPDIIGNDKLLAAAVLLSKSAAWSYEDEYRMVARDVVGDAVFAMTTCGDFLALPEGALTAVVAGCNADVETIQELVDQYAPGLAVKRAIQQPHSYHLNIES